MDNPGHDETDKDMAAELSTLAVRMRFCAGSGIS